MKLTQNKNKRGDFIAVYGANSLGKSTKLVACGHQSFLVIKYPIYELTPTGPKINAILRGPDKCRVDIHSLELQKLYAQNRYDFQPALIDILNSDNVFCSWQNGISGKFSMRMKNLINCTKKSGNI